MYTIQYALYLLVGIGIHIGETLDLWPHGHVPFEFDKKFSNNETIKLKKVFAEIKEKTCVAFMDRTDEVDYVHFARVTEGDCGMSHIGHMEGLSTINVKVPQCLELKGNILHVLMRLLGFPNEENRYNRDEYVTIALANVKPEDHIKFTKFPKPLPKSLEYDFHSVMHSEETHLSINGKPTIVSKIHKSDADLMGQRDDFSEGDLKKINYYYTYCKTPSPPTTVKAVPAHPKPNGSDCPKKKPPNFTKGSFIKYDLKTKKLRIKFTFNTMAKQKAMFKVIRLPRDQDN